MNISSAVLATTLLGFTGLATANASYVDGIVEKIDVEANKIYIMEDESGAVKTYHYEEKARIKTGAGERINIEKLREGDEVTLKLQTAQVVK